MRIDKAISQLQALPQHKELFCQVVAEDGKAWSMAFEFHDIPSSDWCVQLRVFHRELKTLPDEMQTAASRKAERLKHIRTQLAEALDCAHEDGGRRHEVLDESDSDLLDELIKVALGA